jgi:uncharacterized protein (DUF1810 family)
MRARNARLPTAMSDPHNLGRFVTAQDADGTYERALVELRGGHKTGHWMWFVFPQVAGLGQSEMSRKYAISSREEAAAYMRHPVLGPRLIECARILDTIRARSAEQILGRVDAKKLHSSMTLFLRAAPQEPVFARVLDRYFADIPDRATDQRLRAGSAT